MRDRDAIRQYLADHRDRHIARIQEFIRQPTLPSEGTGVPETAELLSRYYRELGCQEVELVETAGEPGVFAYFDAGAPVTIVNYCMFDTKPPDSAKWSVPPFEAKRVRIDPVGEVIMGVGARSRKGPYMSWLNALEALRAVHGTLPVNIVFLAEGEENQGSPNYAAMVDKYADRFKDAVACFSPGAAETSGTMAVRLGYKGLIFGRFRATGSAWGKGPAGRNAHGMAKVLVDSPSWRLVSALASLVEEDGARVAVPGFYDQLVPPTADERAQVAELVKANTGKRWQDVLGGVGGDVGRSSDDLSEEEAYLKYYYEPSFNLNGLSAGYTGPGGPVFSLPGEAWALVDIRVPRGYDVQKVVAGIRAHLEATGRDDVAFEVLSAHSPLPADGTSELLQAVRSVSREFGAELDVQPYTGGGGPWTIYANRFGMPVLFDVGLGHGGRAGAPDEYLAIDESGPQRGLVETELWYATLATELAKLQKPKADAS